MSVSLQRFGKVMASILAHDIVNAEKCPKDSSKAHRDRWISYDALDHTLPLFSKDLGSVLGFGIEIDHLVGTMDAILDEVARIAKHEWHWSIEDNTVYADMPASAIAGSGLAKIDDDSIINVPVDHRKSLFLNFASRDDAMLVRMTIEDLRSVKDADGGDLPQQT